MNKLNLFAAVALAAMLLAGGAEAAGSATTGSLQTTVSQSPAVTAASAYAAGNAVGGLLTFSFATQPSGSGFIQGAWLDFKSTQTAQTDLLLFNVNPTNSTFTDKTALSLATADFNKLAGVIHLADCTSAGTPSICQAMGGATPIRIASGTTLYGVLVTRGTPTFAATSDVQVTLQIIQDLP